VSPILNSIMLTETPNTSAAICGMIVSTPVPISWVPVSTIAVPSGRSRTLAREGTGRSP